MSTEGAPQQPILPPTERPVERPAPSPSIESVARGGNVEIHPEEAMPTDAKKEPKDKEEVDTKTEAPSFDGWEFLESVDRAIQITFDVDALPLSTDGLFKQLMEHINRDCEKAVEVFFRKARSGDAQERLRYATALMRLGLLADRSIFEKALSQNFTNRLAIEAMYQELRQQHKVPDEREEPPKGGLKRIGGMVVSKFFSFFGRKDD